MLSSEELNNLCGAILGRSLLWDNEPSIDEDDTEMHKELSRDCMNLWFKLAKICNAIRQEKAFEEIRDAKKYEGLK